MIERMITMEGSQALNLVKIHATKCGIVFHRTKQLRSWMTAHDELMDLDGRKDLMISCRAGFSSVGDVHSFIDSFLAHVLDGDRELALVIDGQRYVISYNRNVEGKGFNVHYDVQNGRQWIRQQRQGWVFPWHPTAMFDALLESMLSDNWSVIKSPHLISE